MSYAAGPITSALDSTEWAMLRERVATIQAVLRRKYGGATLDQSKNDLQILQRVLDDNVYDETDPDGLRAIGAAFGNVVERNLNFEWVAAETAREREPALRLKTEKSLVVFPLRMIVQAVTSGDRIDLVQQYRRIEGDVKATYKL